MEPVKPERIGLPWRSNLEPLLTGSLPRGFIYTTILELDLQNHSRDGLSGPNSIMVVYEDPKP